MTDTETPVDPDLPDEPVEPDPHRRRRKVLIACGVVLVLLIALAGTAYVYLDRHIHTFSSAGLSKHRPSDNKAMDILLIGTDARGGENTRLGGSGDLVGRSDTTILVHVYPGGHAAVGVSIPRDSLVDIPRCKLPDGSWSKPQENVMFNSAFAVGQTAQGNPNCTVNTVEKLTGLRIDHTIIANFAGFASMSKAVGGVEVCVPDDVYQGDIDPNLKEQGKLVFKKGRQQVEGSRALQYVRVRHGIGDGSDIGRIKRQQAFLSSLVLTIKAKGLQPSHILPLVNAASKTLTFDAKLSNPAKLYSFAKKLIHLDPDKTVFVTVPWRYSGARVAIKKRAAKQLWTALRDNESLAGSPSPKGSTAATASASPGTPGTTAGKKKSKKLSPAITSNMRRATANLCSDLSEG